MAAIQLHRKYLKCILIISALISVFLVFFQLNLPPASSQITEINQHRHDYNVFTLTNSLSSEVPRNLMGLDVRYVINNPICDSTGKDSSDIFMLILITSYVGDVKLRRKLRAILPQSQLDEINTKRLFLLARPPPSFQTRDYKYADVTMKEIQGENLEFHDILMGDFIESYKNLTYKHLMGLEWAATFCENARFVLKQDDDIAVDYFQLSNMLNGTELGNELSSQFSPKIYGKVLENQEVVRDPELKWFTTREQYPDSSYPPFVSGWAYVTTIPAIQELIMASQSSKYFFIDDAFITGILREKTAVSLVDMRDHFTTFKGQLLCCVSVPTFAKSKNNEPYWCDYIVGPSNDDLELMEIYQRHSQYCYTSKLCRRRDENELLSRKCVITGNMKVQDFSQSWGKGGSQGTWKPMAVIRKQ
ncbi:Beta-1,3-galactosyltransferase 1 [Orchesella cincta]|uniref:Hexosyltransferase n=1 Tax=Orchesella cincta TaxID=48709 RepID=A0A1D2NKI8_ORCCI|nr:Beta-1,3-galactosyltransferase 1 [Orchesella cincta]